MNLQHTRMKKMIIKLVLILVAVYSTESKINWNARKLIRMQNDVVECILEP